MTLGGLHAWAAASSHSMNPDGIAYLDMGEAYLRGDWDMAINAYWSPFYAWILGVGMRILNPGMRWEFPAVHLVNFLIYLGALASFEFFWWQLMRYRRDLGSGGEGATLPEWAWPILGYTLFTWSALNLIEMWSVTPDMCVAAFVYLAAGFVLRARVGGTSWRTYALLGIALGLGYLSKAAMFPLAFVFLVVALFPVGNLRRAVPLVLIALIFFILIAGPFVIALSRAKGRPTFGDSGKLNYARYVNGLPDVHWQGEIPGNGTPIHPTRKVHDSPAVYEFAGPVGGTYPPWYDSSYWYEGVALRFDLTEQITVLVSNALFYFELFFWQQNGLIVAILIFYVLRKPSLPTMKQVTQRWGLVFPALAALCLYGLVYVETRYLGPFIVLLWADLLANVRVPNSRTFRRLVSLLSVVIALLMVLNILVFNLEGFRRLADRRDPNQVASPQAARPSWPGEVAKELHELGIQPGDNVAVIGRGFDSFWARLARVQIVAEVQEWEADDFWLGDAALQSQVLKAFASTGAEAVVAENVPGYTSPTGWHRVGKSDYYVHMLAQ